jgi:hypothetical protein
MLALQLTVIENRKQQIHLQQRETNILNLKWLEISLIKRNRTLLMDKGNKRNLEKEKRK